MNMNKCIYVSMVNMKTEYALNEEDKPCTVYVEE